MPGVVIVAIPSQDDYVWRLSSEKIPHMTLLSLGESVDDGALEHMVEFVDHVVNTCMFRFGLSVERRGTLGPKDADVVFFRKDDTERVLAASRNSLLADKTIRLAYELAEQFPEWTPHLTLGYPEAPAKPDPREYPSIQWVNFDKIAVWTGDYEGPEFLLEEKQLIAPSSMYMFDHTTPVIEHFGVKGMKWGVRKDDIRGAVKDVKARIDEEVKARTGEEVVVRAKPGSAVQVVGGNKRSAHEDAVNARVSEQIAKRNTLDALSNQELQKLVTRMNLEQQYRNLSLNEDRLTKGEKYAQKFLHDQGEKHAKKLGVLGPMAQSLAENLIGTSNKAFDTGRASSQQKSDKKKKQKDTAPDTSQADSSA